MSGQDEPVDRHKDTTDAQIEAAIRAAQDLLEAPRDAGTPHNQCAPSRTPGSAEGERDPDEQSR